MKLSLEQIQQMIPHRQPMLLIDEVSSLNVNSDITASIYLNPSWEIFDGHFPGNPILPGAFLVEAMAQACALLLIAGNESDKKLPLLSSLERMRFIRQGKPGDTVVLTAELTHSTDDGLFTCKVNASSTTGRLATGSMTLALR